MPSSELVVPAAEPPEAGQRPGDGRRPNRALEALWFLLGLAGLAGLAVGVFAWLGATVFSPGAVAESYAGLVAEGDFAAATAEAPVSGIDTTLLGDAVARDAVETIADVAVVATEIEGDEAVVTVSFELAGERHEERLELVQNGRVAIFLPRWQLASSLARPVELELAGPRRLELGGAVVALEGGAARVSAYPGVYRVALPGDQPYYELDAEPLVVGPEDPGGSVEPVSLAATPTPELVDAAEEELGRLLDECAASEELNPPGCPFGTHIGSEYQKLRWTIDRYPGLELSADGTAFSTAEDGRASARYEMHDYTGRYWVPGSSEVRIRADGALSADADGVEIVLGV